MSAMRDRAAICAQPRNGPIAKTNPRKPRTPAPGTRPSVQFVPRNAKVTAPTPAPKTAQTSPIRNLKAKSFRSQSNIWTVSDWISSFVASRLVASHDLNFAPSGSLLDVFLSSTIIQLNFKVDHNVTKPCRHFGLVAELRRNLHQRPL